MARTPEDDQVPGRAERLQAVMPLAESLQASIDQQMAEAEQTGVIIDMDSIFETAFTNIAERIMEERVRRLPARDFVELYGRIKGDADLLEKLEAFRALDAQQLDRRLILDRIAQESRISRVLNLGELKSSETVSLGFFNPEKPKQAAKRYADDISVRSLQRVMTVRLIEPLTGEVETLNDNWVGPVWAESAKPDLTTPHARGFIGTETLTSLGTTFEPKLYVSSPISYRFGTGEPITPSQILGYVETADGQVLIDGTT